MQSHTLQSAVDSGMTRNSRAQVSGILLNNSTLSGAPLGVTGCDVGVVGAATESVSRGVEDTSKRLLTLPAFPRFGTYLCFGGNVPEDETTA